MSSSSVCRPPCLRPIDVASEGGPEGGPEHGGVRMGWSRLFAHRLCESHGLYTLTTVVLVCRLEQLCAFQQACVDRAPCGDSCV